MIRELESHFITVRVLNNHPDVDEVVHLKGATFTKRSIFLYNYDSYLPTKCKDALS